MTVVSLPAICVLFESQVLKKNERGLGEERSEGRTVSVLAVVIRLWNDGLEFT